MVTAHNDYSPPLQNSDMDLMDGCITDSSVNRGDITAQRKFKCFLCFIAKVLYMKYCKTRNIYWRGHTRVGQLKNIKRKHSKPRHNCIHVKDIVLVNCSKYSMHAQYTVIKLYSKFICVCFISS